MLKHAKISTYKIKKFIHLKKLKNKTYLDIIFFLKKDSAFEESF